MSNTIKPLEIKGTRVFGASRTNKTHRPGALSVLMVHVELVHPAELVHSISHGSWTIPNVVGIRRAIDTFSQDQLVGFGDECNCRRNCDASDEGGAGRDDGVDGVPSTEEVIRCNR
jgi:hypothetical protein